MNKLGRPAHDEPIRDAYLERFGLENRNPRVTRRILRDSMLNQLSHCKSDEARRLLLGVSEQASAGHEPAEGKGMRLRAPGNS